MKLLGLLGYPLSHTFSPVMMNQIARQNNWDCSYFAYSITPENVEDFVKAVKLLPIYGFNITIPYKQTILKFCDELSPEVQEVGAANTVINNAGKLTSYNSDVFGFKYGIENLISNNFKIDGTLIIGAGGAARAIVYVLSKMGCKKFYLSDVDLARANEWQNDSDVLLKDKAIRFVFPDNETLSDILEEVNLIVQATPVGTFPNIDESISFPFEKLNKYHYVYDLVYNPVETKFVKLAKKAGATANNGLDMLAAQAVKSLDYWGYSVETSVLYNVLMEQIKFKNK